MLSFVAARRVFIVIGFIFVINGLVVTSLNVAGVIPAAYNWQGPVFLVLGAIGLSTAMFALKTPRLWPLVVLTAAFVP